MATWPHEHGGSEAVAAPAAAMAMAVARSGDLGLGRACSRGGERCCEGGGARCGTQGSMELEEQWWQRGAPRAAMTGACSRARQR
jgi:hypothetical protein